MTVPHTFTGYQVLATRGPLTQAEFREATGLKESQASRVIERLLSHGMVKRAVRPGVRNYVYRVAA